MSLTLYQLLQSTYKVIWWLKLCVYVMSVQLASYKSVIISVCRRGGAEKHWCHVNKYTAIRTGSLDVSNTLYKRKGVQAELENLESLLNTTHYEGIPLIVGRNVVFQVQYKENPHVINTHVPCGLRLNTVSMFVSLQGTLAIKLHLLVERVAFVLHNLPSSAHWLTEMPSVQLIINKDKKRIWKIDDGQIKRTCCHCV